MLEVGPTEGAVYENLRAQISSALQGSRLLRQVQQHAAQLEQRVVERTEELTQTVEQLQSEVAERLRVEESLRLVSFAVERATDAVYWVDATARIVDVNEAACRMLGYTRDELVGGMTLRDIDPIFSFDNWANTWATIKEGRFPPLETQHLTRDGRIIPVEVIANYIAFEGKEYNCAFARDITQRKQSEAALRRSEETAREFQEKLKALQEVSLELVSLESIEKLCVRAIELGHSALGYDRLGLLLFEDAEHSIVSRYGIESNGELRTEHGVSYEENETVISSGLLTNQKSVFVSETTDLRDFETIVGRGWNVVTGIWDGQTSIGWLAADNYFDRKPLIPYQVELLNLYGLTIGHLVTRKRAEIEIRRLNDELEQRVAKRTIALRTANDRLQILGRMKDAFVSNVSHELRTPITNMKLYHDLLDRRPEKRDDYTATLRREITRLESLIEALLMLSRLEQDREQFSFASRDLKELLKQFVTDRMALAATKGITLTLELDTDAITIEADQRLLEQVLSILLTNALAYTPAGGRVTVRTLKRFAHDRQWVGFSVSDTGPGISDDEQSHLFERFFRGKAGHDSNMPGTGLGLSIAKEIIDRHEGRIEVYSEGVAGRGAVFSVWLPGK